jgi:hypothetical protein
VASSVVALRCLIWLVRIAKTSKGNGAQLELPCGRRRLATHIVRNTVSRLSPVLRELSDGLQQLETVALQFARYLSAGCLGD